MEEIKGTKMTQAELDEHNRQSASRKMTKREMVGAAAGAAVSGAKAVYRAATSPAAKKAAGYVVRAFKKKESPIVRRGARQAKVSAPRSIGPSFGYPSAGGIGPRVIAPSVNIGPAKLNFGFGRRRR